MNDSVYSCNDIRCLMLVVAATCQDCVKSHVMLSLCHANCPLADKPCNFTSSPHTLHI